MARPETAETQQERFARQFIDCVSYQIVPGPDGKGVRLTLDVGLPVALLVPGWLSGAIVADALPPEWRELLIDVYDRVMKAMGGAPKTDTVPAPAPGATADEEGGLNP